MATKKIKHASTVLILGINGMFGHKIFEAISKSSDYKAIGTVSNLDKISRTFPQELKNNTILQIHAENLKSIEKLIAHYKPSTIINCIGIIKQNPKSKNIKNCIEINALLPHKLASICDKSGTKLITISTDCVFDGKTTSEYLETDIPTCHDIYGMSKYLGEITHGKHLTLRTSAIGHELSTNLGLLDWFLTTQATSVEGYKNAIFSGFTTLEFSKFILEKILPNKNINGVHHISTNPINKYDLLKKIAKIYHKKIKNIPNTKIKINRALNSTILKKQVKYTAPSWDTLIDNSYKDFLTSTLYKHKRKIYEKN